MIQKKCKTTDVEVLAELPINVDLLLLKHKFSHYKYPQKKIFDLTKKGYISRVKARVYFNLKSSDLKNFQNEQIANSLYYPSYVSLEKALEHYGLIPERVETTTSVTLVRSRKFNTPIGSFTYEHINKNRYAVGYQVLSGVEKPFLIAWPEKALLDYITLRLKKVKWDKKNSIKEFLVEDLRIDLDNLLQQVTPEHLASLCHYYHRNSLEFKMIKWLEKKLKEKK